MFTNYSQTYAAAITQVAGLVLLALRSFGVDILPQDLEIILGSVVGAIGFIWQIVQRFRKGGVTVTGVRV